MSGGLWLAGLPDMRVVTLLVAVVVVVVAAVVIIVVVVDVASVCVLSPPPSPCRCSRQCPPTRTDLAIRAMTQV